MRLMLFEAAYRRVQAELAPLSGRLELAIVDGEGRITCNGVDLTPGAVQPDAAWMSADGMMSGAAGVMFGALMAAKQPLWVQSGAAGVDHPIWRQLTAKGAVLTTGHGQAISIAEYVMGEVLAHFQRHPERRANQAARAWTRVPFREVGRTRWLIVGFGAIGQAVAERARGFGADVTGVRRSGGAHPLADHMGTLAEVKSLLPEADVVVLATPLNDATRGLAGASFFAAMKPRSMLVNVGRGDLVDEPALLAALARGAPEFAALDVFHDEPLPADSPFWDHPKVAANPHGSAFGDGQAARNDAIFVENLRRRLAGEPLLYEADPRDLG
jgi:phosphoglycerate dehydrogenase-like enzyme